MEGLVMDVWLVVAGIVFAVGFPIVICLMVARRVVDYFCDVESEPHDVDF